MLFCKEIEDLKGVGVSEPPHPFVYAKKLIRRMHGGSQSILIRGEDEGLYVVKLNGNPQGPNLLANEVLGSELLRSIGLPTPVWNPIVLSEEFLHENGALHFQYSTSTQCIRSGLHFGSKLVQPPNGGEIYHFLPRSFCQRIANPEDFLGIYIFDVWANHHDNRQALFTSSPLNWAINANFIDNGHLFGGPDWITKGKNGSAMCLDQNLYTIPWDEEAIHQWISRFEKSISQSLIRTVKYIPPDWYKGDINELMNLHLLRLERLSPLFQFELCSNRRITPQFRKRISNAAMPLRNSRSLPIRVVSGLCSTLSTP